jgi:Rv0078B-related antitoxin
VANSIAARKLRLALDMYEAGEQMQRMRLRRERPDADVADIEAAVDMWRMTRPGAEAGDSAGQTSTRFT